QAQVAGPGVGVDGERRPRGPAAVEHELGDAADAVAAHLGAAAVRVVHLHAAGALGPVAGADDDEAVRAHAAVAVGEAPGGARGLGDLLPRAIDVDVVVAEPVHLGEFHGRVILNACTGGSTV